MRQHQYVRSSLLTIADAVQCSAVRMLRTVILSYTSLHVSLQTQLHASLSVSAVFAAILFFHTKHGFIPLVVLACVQFRVCTMKWRILSNLEHTYALLHLSVHWKTRIRALFQSVHTKTRRRCPHNGKRVHARLTYVLTIRHGSALPDKCRVMGWNSPDTVSVRGWIG